MARNLRVMPYAQILLVSILTTYLDNWSEERELESCPVRSWIASGRFKVGLLLKSWINPALELFGHAGGLIYLLLKWHLNTD